MSPGIEEKRLREFATAMARRDRSRRKCWLRDEDLAATIRGYAYAAAVAEHKAPLVTGEEIDHAISTYRRVRRLPAQPRLV